MNARVLRELAQRWRGIAEDNKAAHDELVPTNAPIGLMTNALRAAEYALDVATRLDEWATHEEQTR